MPPRTFTAPAAVAALLLMCAGRALAQTHDHAHMDMPMPMEHEAHEPMLGLYGPYPMSREASGTAWQPESATHEGLHLMRGPLFAPGDSRAGEAFTVGKASLSYRYEVLRVEHVVVGLGGLGSVALVPAALRGAYGIRPLAGMVFMRARLR